MYRMGAESCKYNKYYRNKNSIGTEICFHYRMSLSFASFPTGLGYKSSRILGLEEAFIPELRKIEPIPGMSDANRERLERRQRVLDEERRSRFAQEQQHQDESNLVINSCLVNC